MRRPNPWIVVPALTLGALAGWLGWTITAVSCRFRRPDGSVVTCPVSSTVVAVVAFLVVGIGMAVVLVLVYRSIAEWRESQDESQTT